MKLKAGNKDLVHNKGTRDVDLECDAAGSQVV